MPVTMSVRQRSSAGQHTFNAGQCPKSGTYFRACNVVLSKVLFYINNKNIEDQVK